MRATVLLSAVMQDDEVLRTWLRDRGKLSWKKIIEAVEAWEERMRVEMAQAGVTPPGLTKNASTRSYALLRDIAHYRRREMVNLVSEATRLMPVGAHPDVRIRAATVSDTGMYISDLVTVGGSAIAHLLGRDWFVKRYQPTFEAIQEIRRTVDISPASLRKAGSDVTSTLRPF